MIRNALIWAAGWLGPVLLRAWFSTIRFRWVGGVEVHPDPRRRRTGVYVFWHQRLLCFAYTHGRYRPRILVSRSRDGDLIARVAKGLGCFPVRGSSRRGKIEAMRGLLAESRSGCDFGITPDGPLGPRHAFKVGAVYLASQSGIPIVPITVSYGRFWRLRSWDHFLLPWPFTWGVIHVGSAVPVPPGLDAEGLETWRLRLQEILSELTDETDRNARTLYRSGRAL